MPENILFVFEGEKTEHIIARNFVRNYIQSENKTVVKVSFCGEIYQLYKKMVNDDFGIEYVDVFLFSKRDDELKKFKRDDFSQIYLFFDYDPHATNANNNAIQQMLDVFCQETDKGKLFISYPMVECIRYYNGVENDFMNSTIKLDDVHRFKKTVDAYANKKYNNVPQWNIKIWNEVIRIHCVKANYLVHADEGFPSREIMQNSILEKQVELEGNSKDVLVISAFPLMLLSHYGVNTESKLVG